MGNVGGEKEGEIYFFFVVVFDLNLLRYNNYFNNLKLILLELDWCYWSREVGENIWFFLLFSIQKQKEIVLVNILDQSRDKVYSPWEKESDGHHDKKYT